MFDGVVKQAANCPKNLRITKTIKDADECDNEERDESYCSWPNEVIRLVSMTKNTCAEFFDLTIPTWR